MTLFQIALIAATLLVALVAGFVLAFALVAMPGLGTLGDREFLRGFQVIDRVIQNTPPMFMLVWVGSVLATLACGVLGFGQTEGMDRLLLVGAVRIYLFGVQLPTATINVPLNNQLQTLQLETLSEAELAQARKDFEPRWNRANIFRTYAATLAALMLILLALRI